MNRREAIQAGLAVLSAVGIDGEVQTITAQSPQAFVVRVPGRISCEAGEGFRREWKQRFAGTPLENVPVIVLDCGASIEVIDLKAEQ